MLRRKLAAPMRKRIISILLEKEQITIDGRSNYPKKMFLSKSYSYRAHNAHNAIIQFYVIIRYSL